MSHSTRDVALVHVLVPAHNEADAIGGCVRSVAAAARAIQEQVALTVVADRCTDHTVDRARDAWSSSASPSPGELHVVEALAGSAGRARHIGLGSELNSDHLDPATVWVATTDADTEVPVDWLARHLAFAAAGFDAVAGTIDLADWSTLPPGAAQAYQRMLDEARRPDGQHADVFGANLGVRLSALLSVGGFPDMPSGEDHAVWDALQATGHRTIAPTASVVRTSARLVGRAEGGLADLLGDLATEVTA